MKARKMTPKDFAPHLTVVLAELTKNTAGVSVPMAETFEPVCARMGIQVTDFGQSEHGKEGKKTPWVHRQISLAFRQLRDKGLADYAKRGHWGLTQEGLDELGKDTSPAAPSEATLAAAKVQAAAEDQASDDASNLLHLPVAGNEHPYSDDAYIRGLAVEQTACFGAYSNRSDVCKTCLLTPDCIDAIEIRKAEIAADIERDELAAKKAAEAKKKKKDQQDASIDELMESIDKDADDESANFGKKGKYQPLDDQVVSDAFAQRESVCTQCGETIPEHAPCFWVEGEGIFHPQCIEAPDGD